MAILIGVDEAGYGPNYGPLAIAATAWRVAEERKEARGRRSVGSSRQTQSVGRAATAVKRAGGLIPPAPAAPHPSTIDLYKLLKKSVARTAQEGKRRLAIADSKQLYKPGLGLRQLERGVLAALMTTAPAQASCVEHVKALLAATLADPHERRKELDCHAGDELPLPLDAIAEEICQLAEALRKTCSDGGVELLAIRAKLIYPAQFNGLVDRHGTKGAALSHVTLELVREVVDAASERTVACDENAGGEDAPAHAITSDSRSLPTAHSPPPTYISLDKHGGRNRYGAILQHHFPDSWIETIDEGRSASRYRWTHREAPMEAIFRVGCEELLPTALASMTAKYHRELAMRAFNAFWTARLPGLKPTAGYPNDAHRFRADIETLQRELGIDDRVIWRSR
jgi:hypothetical protein